MGLGMSPSKMLVAKIVSHRDLERKFILALEEFGLLEFIDVRQQAGIINVEKTRDEETVFVANERLSTILESLNIDPTRGAGTRLDVDDSTLRTALAYASNVITSVEPEILEIDKDLATAGLELEQQKGIRDVAISLEPLGLHLDRLGVSEYTVTIAGRIETGRVSKLEWSLNEVSEGAYVMNALPLKKGKYSVVSVSIPIELKDAVDRIFTAIGFEAFRVPEGSTGDPEKIAQSASERIIQLEAELDRHHIRKVSIALDWKPRILAAWEILEIEKARIDVKKFLVFTESSIKGWGWIPDGKEEELEAILKEKVGSAFDLTFDEPDFAEHDSPTYLDNPSVMKPTEDVVSAYGVPSKHDLDPTKIMFFSFPLIFGLVFADVGQGFLILLIGIAALRATKKGDDWGQIMGYIQNGGQGLIMMGIFAMFGGFLFGSFFGSETVIQPLWPIFAHYLSNGDPNPYRAAHMLKLSIEVGIIQISLGIILSIYNNLKHRDFGGAFIAVSYLWMYLGFVNLLFGVSYNNINSWFSATGAVNIWLPLVGIGYGIGDNGVYPTLPISPMIFTIMALFVPLLLMMLFSFKGGMDGAVHFLESALGMISHTVSYARIFALNTVHVILSGVFFTLPGLITIPFPAISIGDLVIIPATFNHHGDVISPGLPVLGAIIGTFIVGILEGLLAFMHTLRLHFVEWFSKFYHAGGIAFAPFTAARIHTSLPLSEPQLASSYAVN
ncbi:MAG: V-type ATP synthase subunit I [Candidatus Thorarchaeota archaeon]